MHRDLRVRLSFRQRKEDMKLRTSLIATLVLLAGPAIAQDNDGFYMGAGMGYSKLSINENKLDRLIQSGLDEVESGWALTRSSVDQNATPYQIFAGFRFLNYFAVEVAYLNLGEATYKANISDGSTNSGAIKGTWSNDGVPLSFLGIWPVSDQFDIFGRVGVYYGSTELKARAKDSTGQTILTGSVDDSTTQFFGGAGADWNFTESLTGRAEWQAMPSVGNDDTGSGNFNNFIFSLIYRF
jgi:OOP family OmpA-OmpF porin